MKRLMFTLIAILGFAISSSAQDAKVKDPRSNLGTVVELQKEGKALEQERLNKAISKDNPEVDRKKTYKHKKKHLKGKKYLKKGKKKKHPNWKNGKRRNHQELHHKK